MASNLPRLVTTFKPFASAAAARRHIRKMGMDRSETCYPIRVEGGFAVQVILSDEPSHSLIVGAKRSSQGHYPTQPTIS